MDGYKEAGKIDNIINKLLEKYPVQQNEMEWWRLVRTVKSGLDIIEKNAKEFVRKKSRKIADSQKNDT